MLETPFNRNPDGPVSRSGVQFWAAGGSRPHVADALARSARVLAAVSFCPRLAIADAIRRSVPPTWATNTLIALTIPSENRLRSRMVISSVDRTFKVTGNRRENRSGRTPRYPLQVARILRCRLVMLACLGAAPRWRGASAEAGISYRGPELPRRGDPLDATLAVRVPNQRRPFGERLNRRLSAWRFPRRDCDCHLPMPGEFSPLTGGGSDLLV